MRGLSPRAASRSAVAGAVLAGALLAAGACLSKPALTVASYSIDPPPAPPSPRTGGRVFSLAAAQVASPYAGRPFLYRLAESRIERDPYARFASPPAWLLTSAIRGYLENCDFVRDVVEPGSGVSADARIDPEALDLYGDLQNPGEPTAVLTLRFRVVAPGSPTAGPTDLLNRVYTRRIRVGQRSAAAFADGWNRALSEIMKDFEGDLKALPPGAPAGGGG